MQDRGIDLSSSVIDPATQCWVPLLEARTARWLRVRILGLLSVDSRLHRRVTAKPVEAADDGA